MPFKLRDRFFANVLKVNHVNSWLQFVRGVERSRATHAVWHDCDLFFTDPDFLKIHYETCAARKLACLGVSPPWAGLNKFFEQRGVSHLVATWELMVEVDWARSFGLWDHRGHDRLVDGQVITGDNCYWPQYQTPPQRVARHEREWGFIHHAHVIGAYRRFQRTAGSYEDHGFQLLFQRMLIDALDPSDWPYYHVPSRVELERGMTNPSSRVTYASPDTASHYAEFRENVQKVISTRILGERASQMFDEWIAPWDVRFAGAMAATSQSR